MTALADKVAIVTGASSGIGHATARLFAEQGAKVVVSARRRAELDALVAEIEAAGGEAVALAGDVRDEALAQALVETAVDRFGGLDVAFNNAGTTGAMGPVTEISLADWRETLETNLTSAFLGARHQVPAMLARGGGSLIFTGDLRRLHRRLPRHGRLCREQGRADRPDPGASPPSSAPRGIRANAILPGGTDTPMGRAVANTPEMRALRRGPARAQAPWRRRKRSRARCSTWHPTPRPSRPAPRCWSTAASRSTAPEPGAAPGPARAPHLIASGLIGEPVPRVMLSGGAVNRNS